MTESVCISYYHTTPGRMRARVTGIKRRPESAKALELLMRATPGITTVRANPVTGNVLITFDPSEASEDDILDQLDELGHSLAVADPLSSRRNAPSDELLRDIGMNLGRALFKVGLKQSLRCTIASILIELL